MDFFRDAFGEKTRGGELVALDGCFRIQVKHGKTGSRVVFIGREGEDWGYI